MLLNVARAGLVDPEALLARLRRGDVFACLDVFEDEPPPATDPLRRLPNVFLTSHIAGGSGGHAGRRRQGGAGQDRAASGGRTGRGHRARALVGDDMMVPPAPSLTDIWRRSRFELRRRLRWPVQGRFQPYPHTLPDRYPWLFDFAATALEDVPSPRLLSFGCSSGDEVFSLRRRLPTAAVKGLDINPRNIAACMARSRSLEDDGLTFEVGSSACNEPSGHYDAIFCLAVLCHGDLTVMRARRSEPLFRFADFERAAVDLARCVKPGGLLFLHTTNFRFGDTVAAREFDIVLDARPEQMAPDMLFDRKGRAMPGVLYYPVGFRKRGPLA